MAKTNQQTTATKAVAKKRVVKVEAVGQAHINATPLAGEQLDIPAVFHIIANPLN